jgi:diacylglycerol kinase family enzyme
LVAGGIEGEIMRFIGVLNSGGGIFRTTDMDAFCVEATRVLAQGGHSLECRVVEGSEVVAALKAAAENAQGAVLLAGGGDGTISAAAATAFTFGVPLAVLPAGTMNLFARSLQLPLTPLAALEAIATGELIAIDISTANGQAFVHHFGVGIHPRLVRIRDGLTYNSRFGKIAASLRALWAALIKPPAFQVEVRTPRGVEKRVASGITVSTNPFGEGHLPHADRLDQGVLGVYISAPVSSMALARLFFRVMIGHWKASPAMSEKEVEEVTLNFPRRKHSAKAIIDGELIDLEPQVRLKIHPGALQVMVPAAMAKAVAA